MSEIICRNCQTANPADNKFCTKCGNRLKPDTHLVCPSCYHRNGLNRLHCENCGTRLISNAPLNIEGPAGNRQTVSAPDDKNQPENDELDWLLSGQDVDIEDEKQVTDWLTKLKDSKPLAPLDTEPVNPFAQEGRVEPLEPDESVSLPDWLNDTAVSPDTSPQTAPPPDEELPSWLVGHASPDNDDLDLDREGILGREDDDDRLQFLKALTRTETHGRQKDIFYPFRCLSSSIILRSPRETIVFGRSLDIEELTYLTFLIETFLRTGTLRRQ